MGLRAPPPPIDSPNATSRSALARRFLSAMPAGGYARDSRIDGCISTVVDDVFIYITGDRAAVNALAARTHEGSPRWKRMMDGFDGLAFQHGLVNDAHTVSAARAIDWIVSSANSSILVYDCGRLDGQQP